MFQSSKEIAKLQERITALETELESAKGAHGVAAAEASSLTARLEATSLELAECRTEHATATARIAELEASITAQEATISERIKQADARAEEKISAEVIARCAAAGIDPITRDPEAGTLDLSNEAPKLTGLAKTRAALAAKHKEGYARLN